MTDLVLAGLALTFMWFIAATLYKDHQREMEREYHEERLMSELRRIVDPDDDDEVRWG